MPPAQWRSRGVRILARTALEAVRDPLGNCICEDVARVAALAPPGATFGVIDPFAGSCNALFSVLRHLPGARGLGFEFEQTIFDMTTHDIASLNAAFQLVHGDYRILLGQHRFPAGLHIEVFLAPPWADALTAETGLDLGRTKPLIGDIVDDFERVSPHAPILYVTEVHERLVPEPVAALRPKFDWSEISTCDIAGPTGRYGVLLGAKRWPVMQPDRDHTRAP